VQALGHILSLRSVWRPLCHICGYKDPDPSSGCKVRHPDPDVRRTLSSSRRGSTEDKAISVPCFCGYLRPPRRFARSASTIGSHDSYGQHSPCKHSYKAAAGCAPSSASLDATMLGLTLLVALVPLVQANRILYDYDRNLVRDLCSCLQMT
jgi:hypothetical protein